MISRHNTHYQVYLSEPLQMPLNGIDVPAIHPNHGNWGSATRRKRGLLTMQDVEDVLMRPEDCYKGRLDQLDGGGGGIVILVNTFV